MKELVDGVAACTFLAMARLDCINVEGVPATRVAPSDMLPAVAQSACGIERWAGDIRSAEMAGRHP